MQQQNRKEQNDFCIKTFIGPKIKKGAETSALLKR